MHVNSFVTASMAVIAMAYVTTCQGPQPEHVYRQDGDIVLGGLLALHNSDMQVNACRAIREIQSFKLVEAMVYAVDRINSDMTLLPNIKMGFEIYDTCYNDIVCLGRAMNFVPDRSGLICTCRNVTDNGAISSHSRMYTTDGNGARSGMCCSGKPLVGFVGAERSKSSMQAATLMGLYQTPQISYLSTSDALSDKNVYPYFLRTVPPDRYQVNVIVDLLLHYGWSYVSFLFSDDEYGQYAHTEFVKQTQREGICIALQASLDEYTNDDVYNSIFEDLMTDPYYSRSKAVVIFTQPEVAKQILMAAVRKNAQRNFTWIASDGMGNLGADGVLGLEDAALGMLAIIPFSQSLEDFDQRFLTMNFTTSGNPWAEEYYQKYLNCSGLAESCRYTTANTPSHETLVIDAVYAYAYAMNDLMNEECKNLNDVDRKECVIKISMDGTRLLPYLKSVSFESLSNGNVSFSKYGDGEGRYSIKNYRMNSRGDFEVVRVGFWNETSTAASRLVMDDELVRFYTNEEGNETGLNPPSSICSSDCAVRGARVIIPDSAICCWDCQECLLNQIVVNLTTCVECDPDALPDHATNYTTCRLVDSIPLIYYSWLGPLLVGLSLLGLVSTCVVLALYIINIRDDLIQGSDPVLSLFIIFGILCAFTVGMMLAVPPVAAICVFTRLTASITFTFIYVPLAIKSVRLYRIFRKAKATDSQEEAVLWSLPRQLFLIALAVSLQVAIVLIWMWLTPPEVKPFSYEENGELMIQLACDVRWEEPASTLIYNVPYLIICCVFGMLARHLPDNYHEARFLTFSAFGSCILIIAFIVPYVTSNLMFEAVLYSAIGTDINAMLMLVCIFIIKLYAVYFVTSEVPAKGVGALTAKTLGVYRYRERSRTPSSSSKSSSSLVRRPGSKIKEVTFSDLSKIPGEEIANSQTQSTKL